MTSTTTARPRGCDIFTCAFAAGVLGLDAQGELHVDRARLGKVPFVTCSACASFVEQATHDSPEPPADLASSRPPKPRLPRIVRALGVGMGLMMVSIGAVIIVRTPRSTPIANIIAASGAMSGKTVTITGTAHRVFKAPFSFAVYRVIDQSGGIYVSAKLPPVDGARVRVIGVVHSAPVILGVIRIAPLISETSRATPLF